MNPNRKIFIVDDDAGFRKTLTDILRVKNYEPVAIDKGQTVLDVIKAERPIVALVDLKFEDMSGLTLLKNIKENYPGVECILLTGHASKTSAIEAVNAGDYGYMQKPYDVQQLLLMIRRVIEKQDAETALREPEARYRTLFNSASDVIFICNPAGQFLEAKMAACDRLGFSRDEFLQMTQTDI